MDMLRCIVMDQLGVDLIMAYRRVEKDNLVCDSRYDEVVDILHLLSEHREECPLCRQNQEFIEDSWKMRTASAN